MTDSSLSKKLKAQIIVIVALLICLVITTFALIYSTLTLENNLFSTGSVAINLNDSKSVISEHEFVFEPGMTVKKDFFIENNSSDEIYYKLYFDNVKGNLANVLEITVKDKDKILYNGTAESLTRDGVAAADDTLGVGRRKNLSIYFHYPENAGNDTQNNTLTFDFCADGVQTRNNPQKSFS